MRTYSDLAQDMARLSDQAGNINAWMRSYAPERKDELTRLAQQQQDISRAFDACFAEKTLLDILKREQELKDLLQKQEQQQKELQKKEEFQKADAAEKERQAKELTAKQERDKQELLQKQERDRQENEKQEALRKQELQVQEQKLQEMIKEKDLAEANARAQETLAAQAVADAKAPLQADLTEQQQTVAAQQETLSPQTMQKSSPQENLVSEALKDTLYSSGQAVEALREAAAAVAAAWRGSPDPLKEPDPPPQPQPYDPVKQHPNEDIVSQIIQETIYSAGQTIAALREAAEPVAANWRGSSDPPKEPDPPKDPNPPQPQPGYDPVKQHPNEDIVSQIIQETIYAGVQTLAAMKEVKDLFVTEKETQEFFEQQKKQLGEFMTTQDFQAATGESKEMWLREKFKEQNRAEEAQFANRPDLNGNRAEMQGELKALQESAIELAKREQALQKETQENIRDAREEAEEVMKRLRQSGTEEAAQKAEQLAAALAARIKEVQAAAEEERRAMHEKWLQEQRLLEEQRQRDAMRAAMDFAFH